MGLTASQRVFLRLQVRQACCFLRYGCAEARAAAFLALEPSMLIFRGAAALLEAEKEVLPLL